MLLGREQNSFAPVSVIGQQLRQAGDRKRGLFSAFTLAFLYTLTFPQHGARANTFSGPPITITAADQQRRQHSYSGRTKALLVRVPMIGEQHLPPVATRLPVCWHVPVTSRRTSERGGKCSPHQRTFSLLLFALSLPVSLPKQWQSTFGRLTLAAMRPLANKPCDSEHQLAATLQ